MEKVFFTNNYNNQILKTPKELFKLGNLQHSTNSNSAIKNKYSNNANILSAINYSSIYNNSKTKLIRNNSRDINKEERIINSNSNSKEKILYSDKKRFNTAKVKNINKSSLPPISSIYKNNIINNGNYSYHISNSQNKSTKTANRSRNINDNNFISNIKTYNPTLNIRKINSGNYNVPQNLNYTNNIINNSNSNSNNNNLGTIYNNYLENNFINTSQNTLNKNSKNNLNNIYNQIQNINNSPYKAETINKNISSIYAQYNKQPKNRKLKYNNYKLSNNIDNDINNYKVNNLINNNDQYKDEILSDIYPSSTNTNQEQLTILSLEKTILEKDRIIENLVTNIFPLENLNYYFSKVFNSNNILNNNQVNRQLEKLQTISKFNNNIANSNANDESAILIQLKNRFSILQNDLALKNEIIKNINNKFIDREVYNKEISKYENLLNEEKRLSKLRNPQNSENEEMIKSKYKEIMLMNEKLINEVNMLKKKINDEVKMINHNNYSNSNMGVISNIGRLKNIKGEGYYENLGSGNNFNNSASNKINSNSLVNPGSQNINKNKLEFLLKNKIEKVDEFSLYQIYIPKNNILCSHKSINNNGLDVDNNITRNKSDKYFYKEFDNREFFKDEINNNISNKSEVIKSQNKINIKTYQYNNNINNSGTSNISNTRNINNIRNTALPNLVKSEFPANINTNNTYYSNSYNQYPNTNSNKKNKFSVLRKNKFPNNILFHESFKIEILAITANKIELSSKNNQNYNNKTSELVFNKKYYKVFLSDYQLLDFKQLYEYMHLVITYLTKQRDFLISSIKNYEKLYLRKVIVKDNSNQDYNSSSIFIILIEFLFGDVSRSEVFLYNYDTTSNQYINNANKEESTNKRYENIGKKLESVWYLADQSKEHFVRVFSFRLSLLLGYESVEINIWKFIEYSVVVWNQSKQYYY